MGNKKTNLTQIYLWYLLVKKELIFCHVLYIQFGTKIFLQWYKYSSSNFGIQSTLRGIFYPAKKEEKKEE